MSDTSNPQSRPQGNQDGASFKVVTLNPDFKVKIISTPPDLYDGSSWLLDWRFYVVEALLILLASLSFAVSSLFLTGGIRL